MAEAGAKSPNLDEAEQQQAARHAPLRPLVIHEILREQGEHELDRSTGSLLLSALAAGLSMGFSFLALALLRSGMPDAPWRHLVASLGYTVGFVIVVMGGQQLFTENTLTAVLPVLTKRDLPTFARMLRLWGLVLAANIAATWVFAWLVGLPGVVKPETTYALYELAGEATADPVLTTFLKAIFAGWLIALMVWLTPTARAARIWVIVILTWLVGLGQFSHIIAGSTEAAYGVIAGLTSLDQYWLGFFLPTLGGNIVGGVSLVSLLNHGSVSEELDTGDAA